MHLDRRRFLQSAGLYFGGADNDPPTEAQTAFPPPAAYLGQAAEPVIPLLFDARGKRHAAAGRPV